MFLAANKIPYRKFQFLHLARQPKGQLRQPKGAYQKRNHDLQSQLQQANFHHRVSPPLSISEPL